MKNTVSRINLNLLTEHLFSRYGLFYSAKKEEDLRNAIIQTAEYLHIDANTVIEKLQTESERDKISGIILDNLKINETYFFREEQTLYKVCSEVLKKSYLETTRIWSAGCSTGEEPYSLIMILAEQNYILSNTSFVLDATDVNPNSIERAKAAVYSDWAFRNTSSEVRSKYFDKKDDEYEFKQNLRKRVNFNIVNLTGEISSSMNYLENYYDIILCRNVLIYFNEDMRKKIFNNFFHTLKPGGLLFTGLTEIAFLKDTRFEKLVDKEMIYFRKPVKNILTESPEAKVLRTNDKIFSSEKTANNHPQQDEFSLSKAQLFYNYGEYGKCVESIKTGFQNQTDMNIYTDDNCDFIRLLINSYINTGNFKSAVTECQKYIRYNKNDHNFYLMLANLYVHSDDNDSAIDNLIRAIYLEPDYIQAHLLLGKTYLSIGEKTSARKHYETTLKLAEKLNADCIIEDTDGFSAGSLVQLINGILNKL